MEIKVGKYTLRSDKFSMWLEEEYVSQEEKTKGKLMTKQVAGYCCSWKSLLDDFIDKKIEGSDAQSIKELIEVIKQAVEDAKSLNERAIKEDFRIIRRIEKEIK